jgi:hypothetical protein
MCVLDHPCRPVLPACWPDGRLDWGRRARSVRVGAYFARLLIPVLLHDDTCIPTGTIPRFEHSTYPTIASAPLFTSQLS